MSRRISRRDLAAAEYGKAKNRLEALERKLALHFRQALLGVIEWDTALRVNAWNPAAEAIFGYSGEEALGRSARELILPADVLGQIDIVWDNLLKLKGGEYNTNKNLTRDGRIILCEWFNTPLVDSDGTIVGVMSLVRDITERRRIEEALQLSENRYRTMFETTGAATVMIEANTVITLVNSEFERLTGYTREETEGKLSWTILIPWEEEQRRIAGYHRQRRNDAPAAPKRYETRIADKQGQIHDILVNVNMIPETQQSIATILDISDRKRDEAALRYSSEELMAKAHELEETNTALRVLLKQRQREIDEIEERLMAHLKEQVLPHVGELKTRLTDREELTQVRLIESRIRGLFTPYAEKISRRSANLTFKEVRVANLIVEGMTTKEIARSMNLSRFAIDTHRAQLRKKLGLSRKKINLRTFLSSLSE